MTLINTGTEKKVNWNLEETIKISLTSLITRAEGPHYFFRIQNRIQRVFKHADAAPAKKKIFVEKKIAQR